MALSAQNSLCTSFLYTVNCSWVMKHPPLLMDSIFSILTIIQVIIIPRKVVIAYITRSHNNEYQRVQNSHVVIWTLPYAFLAIALHIIIHQIMIKSDIQILKNAYNGYNVSLYSEKSSSFVFFLHLSHQSRQESYIIEVSEPIQVETSDSSTFGFSPINLYNNIMKNHEKCMQVTENVEVVLILQCAGESVSVLLPKAKKDQSRNIGTEVRFKKLAERIEETSLYNQHYFKKLQDRIQEMGMELQRLKGKGHDKIVEKKEMDKRSQEVDAMTLKILKDLTQQPQANSIDCIVSLKEDIDNQIIQLRERVNEIEAQGRAQVNRAYEDISKKIEESQAVTKQELRMDMKEQMNNINRHFEDQMIEVNERADRIGEQARRYIMQLDQQAKQYVMNIANSLYLSDQSSSAIVAKQRGVAISNLHTSESYNYFFSRFYFPPNSFTTLVLQTTEKDVLFGLCDQSCLKSQQIFKQTGAFFFYLMDYVEQYKEMTHSEISKGTLSIIMKVDLQRWTVSWRVKEMEGNEEIKMIPQQMRNMKFHPTVLINIMPSEQVLLSFG